MIDSRPASGQLTYISEEAAVAALTASGLPPETASLQGCVIALAGEVDQSAILGMAATAIDGSVMIQVGDGTVHRVEPPGGLSTSATVTVEAATEDPKSTPEAQSSPEAAPGSVAESAPEAESSSEPDSTSHSEAAPEAETAASEDELSEFDDPTEETLTELTTDFQRYDPAPAEPDPGEDVEPAQAALQELITQPIGAPAEAETGPKSEPDVPLGKSGTKTYIGIGALILGGIALVLPLLGIKLGLSILGPPIWIVSALLLVGGTALIALDPRSEPAGSVDARPPPSAQSASGPGGRSWAGLMLLLAAPLLRLLELTREFSDVSVAVLQIAAAVLLGAGTVLAMADRQGVGKERSDDLRAVMEGWSGRVRVGAGGISLGVGLYAFGLFSKPLGLMAAAGPIIGIIATLLVVSGTSLMVADQNRVRLHASAALLRRVTHIVVVCAASLAALRHQLVLKTWFIEDAAISFAYSRHFAAGEGLVPYVGGERIEGFSNPLWVFMMTGWDLIGIDGFTSAKIMAGILAVATVPIVYWIARYARPNDTENDAALVAPLVIAASAQFAIWGACGLENSLFCFLMALGIWRTLVELDKGGWPWSALVFFALAITRPEGAAYGFFAWSWGAVLHFNKRRDFWMPLKWIATFTLPFSAYHAVRFSYFGWELPNTYYAKLEDSEFKLYNWQQRPWKYVKGYAHELWQGYFIPLYIMAATGLKGARGLIGLLFAIAVCIVLLYPGTDAMKAAFPGLRGLRPPEWWIPVRVWTLIGLAVITPLAIFGRRGWHAITLVWGMGMGAVIFTVYTGGDWMKGYRWFSLVTVPASVMFAVLAGELADLGGRLTDLVSRSRNRTEPRPWGVGGWLAAAAVAVLMLPPNIAHTDWFDAHRETGPYKVRKRVTYINAIQDRLHLDEATLLDVDMGATMYWSGDSIIDMAGLIDVIVAHHDNERAFVREYVFQERIPDFAHVHGAWANKTKIPTHPEWKQNYIEIPGYPVSKRALHTGNHIRRGLILTEDWVGPRREITFQNGVSMVGFDVPSDRAGQGMHWFIETAIKTRKRTADEPFRMLTFLANEAGQIAAWDLPPGLDLYGAENWKKKEIFFAKNSLPLAESLLPGTYDIGFVMLDENGRVVEVSRPDGGEPLLLPEGAMIGGGDNPPRFAAGEVRFPGALTIVSAAELQAEAEAGRQSALSLAGEAKCEEAQKTWLFARRQMTRHEVDGVRWELQHKAEMGRAFAGCWVDRAEEKEEAEEKAPLLAAARLWDHNAPRLIAAADPVADTLTELGDAAIASEDWERAYALLSMVMRVDATRSHVRRRAEYARGYRLGIDAESRAIKDAEKKKKRAESEKRREKREKELFGDPDEQPRSKGAGGRSKAQGAGRQGPAGAIGPSGQGGRQQPRSKGRKPQGPPGN